MSVKFSYYNWTFDIYGNVYLYNNLTGAIAVLDKDEYAYLDNIYKSGNTFIIDHNNDILLSSLYNAQFIIDSDSDELNMLNMAYLNRSEFFGKTSVTITVTQECNLRCVYCYQDTKPERKTGCIEKATIDKFVEYLYANPNNTTVSFYGGEPLLYANRCIEISNRVKNVQNDLGMEYRASITSNGTLLSCEIAEQLKQSGVEHAQITIDGPKDIHNLMRPYTNGSGSYREVIENVKSASKHLRISLRVNICKDTSNFTPDFLCSLSSISKNVKVYVAPLRLKAKANYCTSREVYNENRDYMIENYGSKFRQYKLSANISGCGATYRYGFVLDCDGSMYKCWSDIGSDSKPISSIHKDIEVIKMDLEEAHMKWREFNPYSHIKCKACKMLPTCGGGCPEEFILTSNPRCEFTAKQFEAMMRHRIMCGLDSANSEMEK